MSFAIAVRIEGSSVRSIAARAGHPCGAARRSATRSIESVAEPPLPKTSSLAAAHRRSPAAPPPPRAAPPGPASVLLAQLADLLRLHQHIGANVLDHLVQVRSPPPRGTGRGSSRRRCRGPGRPRGPRAARGARRRRGPAPRARGRAFRRAPAGRTGRRWAARTPTRLRRARKRSSGSRADWRGQALGRLLCARLVGAERDRDVLGLGDQLDLDGERAALAGESDRRQRALADDHRVDELDGDVPDVRTCRRREPQRDQPAAAGEALCHPVAAARDVDRRSVLEEGSVRLGPLREERVEPPRRRDGQTAAASLAATSDSHSPKASVPSPVLALHSITCAPGFTDSRLCRSFSRS